MHLSGLAGVGISLVVCGAAPSCRVAAYTFAAVSAGCFPGNSSGRRPSAAKSHWITHSFRYRTTAARFVTHLIRTTDDSLLQRRKLPRSAPLENHRQKPLIIRARMSGIYRTAASIEEAKHAVGCASHFHTRCFCGGLRLACRLGWYEWTDSARTAVVRWIVGRGIRGLVARAALGILCAMGVSNGLVGLDGKALGWQLCGASYAERVVIAFRGLR